MTRTAFVVAIVLTASLVLAASPATAQDALSRRVSLDIKAMAPAGAFKVIGDSVGMKVTVAPDVTTPVDVLLKNVTAKTALTTICESIGCKWAVSGGAIVVTPSDGLAFSVVGRTDNKADAARAAMYSLQASLKQKLPAGMKFENAPLAEVSARLSDALNLKIEIITEDQTLKTLTADFSNQLLIEALKDAFPPGDRVYLVRIAIAPRGDTGGTTSPTVMISIAPRKKK